MLTIICQMVLLIISATMFLVGLLPARVHMMPVVIGVSTFILAISMYHRNRDVRDR